MNTLNVKSTFVNSDLEIGPGLHMFIMSRDGYWPIFFRKEANRCWAGSIDFNADYLKVDSDSNISIDNIKWRRTSEAVYSTVSFLGFYQSLIRFTSIDARDAFEYRLLTSPSRCIEFFSRSDDGSYSRKRKFAEVVTDGRIVLIDDMIEGSTVKYSVNEWYGHDSLGGFSLIEEEVPSLNRDKHVSICAPLSGSSTNKNTDV